MSFSLTQDIITALRAAASAAWFWAWKMLNPVADGWDLATLTRRINGGLIGLADRQRACTAALAALGAR